MVFPRLGREDMQDRIQQGSSSNEKMCAKHKWHVLAHMSHRIWAVRELEVLSVVAPAGRRKKKRFERHAVCTPRENNHSLCCRRTSQRGNGGSGTLFSPIPRLPIGEIGKEEEDEIEEIAQVGDSAGAYSTFSRQPRALQV